MATKKAVLKVGDQVMFGTMPRVGAVLLNGWYRITTRKGDMVTLGGVPGRWHVKAFAYLHNGRA